MTTRHRSRHHCICAGLSVFALIVCWDVRAFAQTDYATIFKRIQEASEAHISQARDETEQLRLQKIELAAHLAKVQQVQGWALHDFRDLRTETLRSKEGDPRLFDRFRRIQEVSAKQFVDLPATYSPGAVRSGRALNFFLDALGDVAMQHDQFIKKFINTELQDVPENQVERLKIVEEVDHRLVLPVDTLRDLRCEYGLTSPKLPVRLSSFQAPIAEILPLDWPTVFYRERRFTRLLKPIEESRKDALDEIQKGEVLGPGQSRLMAAVDDLQKEVDRWRIEILETRSGKRADDVIAATKTMRTLRYGISRLIETKVLNIAPFSQPRKGSRYPGDKQFTVIQLLAHCKANGLRFVEASPSSEVAYALLMRQMVDYYQAMVSLQMTVNESARAVRLTEAQIQDAVEFERKMMIAEKVTETIGLLMYADATKAESESK